MPKKFDHNNIGNFECCQITDKQLQELDIKNDVGADLPTSSKVKNVFRIIGISLILLALIIFIVLIFVL